MSNFLSNYSPTWPRINRLAYVKYLAIILVLVFISLVSVWLAENIITPKNTQTWGFGGFITWLAQIFLFFAITSLSIRRNHDVGISGWWILVGIIIPFYPLIFCFIPGTKWPNKYWPDPLEKQKTK